jgi:SAM-dependent methyltransferase
MRIDADDFRRAYRRAVEDVLPYFDRERLKKVAAHNPGWGPDRHDIRAYLRASEQRYVHALGLIDESDGAVVERSRILDVGGFFAAFPLALARLGCPVTLSEKYAYYYGAFDDLRGMLEHEGVQVWDEDLTEPMPPRDERFDVILAMAIIEHLHSTPKPLMDNVTRLLSDSGKLVLEVPNIAYWPKRLGALLGGSVHPPLRDVYEAAVPFTGHHREYTIDELRDLVAWSGLDLCGERAFNYTPEPERGLYWLLWSWPRRHLPSAREVLMVCARRPEGE